MCLVELVSIVVAAVAAASAAVEDVDMPVALSVDIGRQTKVEEPCRSGVVRNDEARGPSKL